MKQYIVDAFTDKPFAGNPAAVCVMDAPLPDSFMQMLAVENNFSETAFLLREGEGWRLRWFTPGTEVNLCGHATLASSFVLLNDYEKEKDSVRFFTRSGVLTVTRKGGLYEMDFPVCPQREIPVTDEMEAAFGVRPVKALLGPDLVCVFADEEEIRRMTGTNRHRPRRGKRLRIPQLFPEARHPRGPCLRLGALPNRSLLGRGHGQDGNPCLPGVEAGRPSLLPPDGERTHRHQRRSGAGRRRRDRRETVIQT